MIGNYLSSFVNKQPEINSLLDIAIKDTSSKYGAIFMYSDIDKKYRSIASTINDIAVDKTLGIIKNIGFSSYGILTQTQISSIIVVPIFTNKKHLGMLCLLNSEHTYTEKSVIVITPHISILQLILNTRRLEASSRYMDEKFSKNLFLANMSHEIRTPLNGVIGYNQLLMQTSLNTIQKVYLSSMNNCSIQLMQIINDILDFSKLASCKMLLNSECFSTKEISESVNNAMGQRIKEKKQTIDFTISDNIPEYIIADKQKFIQVLINLVSNACKFTDKKGTISVTFVKTEKSTLCVHIKDSGIGISSADQDKLFNAFVQINDTVYKSVGTGLGLAISKKLTELMGGTITVSSELGKGSTFSFTINYSPYEGYEKKIEADAVKLKGKTVIVVDDNVDNRILITEMLFELEMNPIVCGTALEALRMILSNRYKFDLGLIDICMPKTSGIELAKQIKEEKPFLPLVALSSTDLFVDTTDFIKKLDKPINKVQLFNTIYRIVTSSNTPKSYIGKNIIEPPISPTSRSKKEINVLIAEDIIYNRNLLVEMLKTTEYKHILAVENGVEALEKIRGDKKYDILLLDFRMPIMGGLQMLKEAKNLNINLPEVVVVTASIMEEDVLECKNLGVKYFINKPIDFSQLKNIMSHISESCL